MGERMDRDLSIEDDAERRNVTNRLRRLQGQIRGLASMISSGQGCEAVLTQVMAARSALGQVGLHVIGYSMKRCLSDDPQDEAGPLVDRAFEVFTGYRTLAASAASVRLEAPATVAGLVSRLREVESALVEVQTDLEAGTPCERIVTRVGEVTSMLNDVALGVLGHSMRECLAGSDTDREQVIDSAITLFLKYSACLK